MKPCSRCQRILPPEDFHHWNKGWDGLTADCKTCRNAIRNEARRRNPDQGHAQSKRWRAANLGRAKEQCLASAKRHRATHREEFAEYSRQYNIRNRERRSAYSREWRAANPRKAAENAMRAWYKRQARLKQVEHEDLDRWEIYERDGGICHLCNESVEPRDFELDHIIPISRGGGHIRKNVATSHMSCNRSKGAKIHEGHRSGAGMA